MSDAFANVYDDAERARAYDALDFPGTYHLAFRDLPELIGTPLPGARALDFGCGAGRSTRFLQRLGFLTTGVDIAAPMLERARARDPQGDYRLVLDGELGDLPAGAFALVLSAFAFDNIPTGERKAALLAGLARLLAPGGRLVNLVSAPEIYTHEWASFSTRDFPENHTVRCGDRVRIVMLDVEDRRPVEDVLWTDEGYREAYARAGLRLLETRRPLGRAGEPFAWVSETTVAPWVIYLLARDSADRPAAAPCSGAWTRPETGGRKA
jgi:SAM-dependent methyltransferase